MFYKKDYHPQPFKVIAQIFGIGLFAMVPVFAYKYVYQNYLPELAEYAIFQPLLSSPILSGFFFFTVNLVILSLFLTTLSAIITIILTFFKHETLENIKISLKENELCFIAVSVMTGLLIYFEKTIENIWNMPIVNTILGAILFDSATVANVDDFFSKKARMRSSLIKEQLGTYPRPLLAYLETVSKEQFTQDASILLPIVSAKVSIMSDGAAVMGNKLVKAFIAFLKNDLVKMDTNGNTMLHKTLKGFEGEGMSGKMLKRILIREAQSVLLHVEGEESATVQLATDLSETKLAALTETLSEQGGIPQFIINEELIGGMRLFKSGTLRDASWRARVNTLFSAIG